MGICIVHCAVHRAVV